jgi:hypothetical protein
MDGRGMEVDALPSLRTLRIYREVIEYQDSLVEQTERRGIAVWSALGWRQRWTKSRRGGGGRRVAEEEGHPSHKIWLQTQQEEQQTPLPALLPSSNRP